MNTRVAFACSILAIGMMVAAPALHAQSAGAQTASAARSAHLPGDKTPPKDPPFSFKSPERFEPEKPLTPYIPPMFGDQFQFGGGFQLGQLGGGGFQGGFQSGFQGGFQGGSGFQGGFQGGSGFQGGFQGGSGFQGGFQGGFQFGAPIAPLRGAYKIAENESPRPDDRVYVSYNYFNNVASVADVHRETIGIEKTLFRTASVGLRLPFVEVQRDPGSDTEKVGDLSVILKYAPYLNTDTGSAFSLGLAVTAPTGPMANSFVVRNRKVDLVHSTLLQPFIGAIWNRGGFFVQGFTSALIPTDSDDVTVLSNDIGFGYRIIVGGRFLDTIVPTIELHVNTPLNHRGGDDLPRFRDAVDLTGGFHVVFTERVVLGLAVGAQLNEPRLFDVEGLVNLNVRF